MTTKPTKLPNYDLQILVGWYMEAVKHLPKQQWPKIVIILQDFESFEPHVLQDFMSVMSEYRAILPIVFIIGIATSTEILHQSLDKSTLSLLRIEKFWLQQSDVWFNRVLDSLFIDSNFTLKFGARPFKFLLDHFYLYDFSISKVKSSIKYALMHHFYGNPLSVFTQLYGLASEEITTILKQWYQNGIITEHHATHIRMLRSFRDYIESISETNPTLALKLLDDDEYLLIKQLPSWILGLDDYQKEFKRGMGLLQLLQSQFPAFTNLKKKTKRLIYLELLENVNWQQQSDTLHWLIHLVRKLSPADLDPFLEKLKLKLLEGDNSESNVMLANEIEEKQLKLQSIVQANAEEISKMKRKEKKLEGLIIEQDYTDTAGNNSRQTKTAEKVQENAIAQLKERGSLISKLAIEVADWFKDRFEYDLRSYTKLPMHELIYYTHVKLHEKSFAPQPRGTIQSALTLPQYYLNCECCHQNKNEEYSLLSTENDSCILYKLYLECGRMINLYDWFVAFSCIIEREARPKDHPLIENEVQARFIRSVAELQFLGFIKPTGRKTDHVIRLTWSNI
ncbi:origin recognition complex subunit 3 N-terminus-domain-containing protein [Cunninghamella echinulata]|nr:origin recognition complex subunit 3 N-terminus-domain-containing protein [Cunninghamella echinulata]